MPTKMLLSYFWFLVLAYNSSVSSKHSSYQTTNETESQKIPQFLHHPNIIAKETISVLQIRQTAFAQREGLLLYTSLAANYF